MQDSIQGWHGRTGVAKNSCRRISVEQAEQGKGVGNAIAAEPFDYLTDSGLSVRMCGLDMLGYVDENKLQILVYGIMTNPTTLS